MSDPRQKYNEIKFLIDSKIRPGYLWILSGAYKSLQKIKGDKIFLSIRYDAIKELSRGKLFDPMYRTIEQLEKEFQDPKLTETKSNELTQLISNIKKYDTNKILPLEIIDLFNESHFYFIDLELSTYKIAVMN